MKKRGQFYLIAALIIIIILSGLGYVYTSIRAPRESFDIRELAEEIHYEGRQLVDNRAFAGESIGQIALQMKDNFASYYMDKYPNIDIIIVFGTQSEAYVINRTGKYTLPIEDEGGKKFVKARLYGEEHKLEMKENQQNFYVVVGREKEGERNVVVL